MIELFLFYKLSFVVAGASAAGLSWLGLHQLPRKQIVELFALSQLALLGNLTSKLIFHDDSHYFGLAMSFIFFTLGSWLLKKSRLLNSTEWLLGLYTGLVALQYLLIGLFPILDAHLSIGFFGNIVTSTFVENTAMILIF